MHGGAEADDDLSLPKGKTTGILQLEDERR